MVYLYGRDSPHTRHISAHPNIFLDALFCCGVCWYVESMTTPQTAPSMNDLTLLEEDRKELIGWAARCVRRLLPIFEKHRPLDRRLHDALEAVEYFQRGTLSVGAMRQQAFLCHAAARECTDSSAQAVARACGQAVATAHMGAHARNIGRYTRKALSGKLLTEELEWQRAHIPARFHSYVFGC